MKTLFSICALFLAINFTSAALQRYSVKGKFMCGTKPAVGVKVKLIDIDPGLDDEMDKTTTDSEGSFLLDGSNNEWTNIDPVLKAYHDCDDSLPGQRRLKMTLPDKYIKKGGGTPQVLDIGVVNLEPRHYGEERDYI